MAPESIPLSLQKKPSLPRQSTSKFSLNLSTLQRKPSPKLSNGSKNFSSNEKSQKLRMKDTSFSESRPNQTKIRLQTREKTHNIKEGLGLHLHPHFVQNGFRVDFIQGGFHEHQTLNAKNESEIARKLSPYDLPSKKSSRSSLKALQKGGSHRNQLELLRKASFERKAIDENNHFGDLSIVKRKQSIDYARERAKRMSGSQASLNQSHLSKGTGCMERDRGGTQHNEEMEHNENGMSGEWGREEKRKPTVNFNKSISKMFIQKNQRAIVQDSKKGNMSKINREIIKGEIKGKWEQNEEINGEEPSRSIE